MNPMNPKANTVLPTQQRRMLFYEGKGGVVRIQVFPFLQTKSPMEQTVSSKCYGFSLAEFDRLLLAGLLSVKEKIFLLLG